MPEMTLKLLLGSILSDIVQSRMLADGASARVAHQYLNHDYLKGFPIPRMHIKDVELDLRFAIASVLEDDSGNKTGGTSEQAKHDALTKTQLFLRDLAQDSDVSKRFTQNTHLLAIWNAHLEGLATAIRTTVHQWRDRVATAATIALAVNCIVNPC